MGIDAQDASGTEMTPWTETLGRLRLDCSGLTSRLARVPLLGRVLRAIGSRVLPRGSLVWTTIQSGHARGLWILVDARSGTDLRSGDREPAVQEALKRHLAPGRIFYDVGANAGFFALIASRCVGPSGMICAFEAEPDAALRLKRVVERNALRNVTVVEAAVWSGNGELFFDRGLGSPDRLVGHVVQDSNDPECISVPAVSLDDFARTSPPPHVIKCDVEGAEVEVFRGSRRLLEEGRPTVICEVHSSENLRQVRSLFQEAGYALEMLDSEESFPIHILAVPCR